MNLLPFLLLTPLVWLIVTVSFLNGSGDLVASAFIGAFFTAFFWGVLLLVIK